MPRSTSEIACGCSGVLATVMAALCVARYGWVYVDEAHTVHGGSGSSFEYVGSRAESASVSEVSELQGRVDGVGATHSSSPTASVPHRSSSLAGSLTENRLRELEGPGEGRLAGRGGLLAGYYLRGSRSSSFDVLPLQYCGLY